MSLEGREPIAFRHGHVAGFPMLMWVSPDARCSETHYLYGRARILSCGADLVLRDFRADYPGDSSSQTADRFRARSTVWYVKERPTYLLPCLVGF